MPARTDVIVDRHSRYSLDIALSGSRSRRVEAAIAPFQSCAPSASCPALKSGSSCAQSASDVTDATDCHGGADRQLFERDCGSQPRRSGLPNHWRNRVLPPRWADRVGCPGDQRANNCTNASRGPLLPLDGGCRVAPDSRGVPLVLAIYHFRARNALASRISCRSYQRSWRVTSLAKSRMPSGGASASAAAEAPRTAERLGVCFSAVSYSFRAAAVARPQTADPPAVRGADRAILPSHVLEAASSLSAAARMNCTAWSARLLENIHAETRAFDLRYGPPSRTGRRVQRRAQRLIASICLWRRRDCRWCHAETAGEAVSESAMGIEWESSQRGSAGPVPRSRT